VLPVPLQYDEATQDWAMDYDAMERLVTPRTRMFVLCNPHNPVRACVAMMHRDAWMMHGCWTMAAAFLDVGHEEARWSG
jgi:hypothetical protein